MIYADYNGSAPLCEEVRQYLLKRLENNGPYANPNAIHHLGQKVLTGMENARSVCAKSLGAKYRQLFFNSGSTEGIATVFHSVLFDAHQKKKNIIITSGIEHSAIINTAEFYRDHHNFQVELIPVNENGEILTEQLESFLQQHGEQVALVTLMAANNETGVIQDYKKMAQICQKANVPFFCDTTQIIGKAPFNFEESQADFAIMSGHKIGAMTGTGILLAKEPTTLRPLIIGGGQEKSLRGGTQNYLGIETLAVALDYIQKNYSRIEELKAKRLAFEQSIKTDFPHVQILGEQANRLATTTYISHPGIHGQAVQIELESQGIFVTTSSACSDNEPVTSKVLKAMGVNDETGRGVVRISLGLCAPLEAYDKIEEALKKSYLKLGAIQSY